jgi:cytochrome c peroxidase
MITRALLFTVLASLSACKDKDAKPAETAAGSGSAPMAPARPRPSQQPLPQMPPLTLGEDAKRAEKIALGHALFFDKRLSGGTDRSCYSCHANEDGNGGAQPVAIGSGGKTLTRHSPVIWNVAYWNNAFYWDGRAKTLEDTARGAWGGGNMGAAPDADTPEKIIAALDAKAAEVAALPELKKLFDAAYPGTAIKTDHVTGALAAYMRTLICRDTAYDKFAIGDKTALTDEQQRGLDVFLGKGKCGTCHAPPFFSTAMGVEGGAYFNVGIGTQGVPEDKVDIGRMKVSTKPEDWAAFKPPSLRNVARSKPYFHDGSAPTLEDAVKLMSTGGLANKNKTPLLMDAGLTDAERADLIAFLGGLTCPGAIEPPVAATP